MAGKLEKNVWNARNETVRGLNYHYSCMGGLPEVCKHYKRREILNLKELVLIFKAPPQKDVVDNTKVYGGK